MNKSSPSVVVEDLGVTPYGPVFERMQKFTEQRDAQTADQIWLTEHEPVFTQGQAGKAEHLLAPGDIEVVQSDRGGQVTYHGPGQITAYLLFDLRRLGIGVRDLVTGIEVVMVDTLACFDIQAKPRADAPGVYVGPNKIGSLGLRVRRGCSYHGLSLNVNMDLEPFGRINPCGLFGIEVVDMARETGGAIEVEQVKPELVASIVRHFGLTVS